MCYSNIYNLYMYRCEPIRNLLIGYLTFILVIGNLETTNRLTGYSVKVHIIIYGQVILNICINYLHLHASVVSHRLNVICVTTCRTFSRNIIQSTISLLWGSCIYYTILFLIVGFVFTGIYILLEINFIKGRGTWKILFWVYCINI